MRSVTFTLLLGLVANSVLADITVNKEIVHGKGLIVLPHGAGRPEFIGKVEPRPKGVIVIPGSDKSSWSPTVTKEVHFIGGQGSPFNDNGEWWVGSSCKTQEEVDKFNSEGHSWTIGYHACEKNSVCLDGKCVSRQRGKLPLPVDYQPQALVTDADVEVRPGYDKSSWSPSRPSVVHILGGQGTPWNENGEWRLGTQCKSQAEVDKFNSEGHSWTIGYRPCEKGAICAGGFCVTNGKALSPVKITFLPQRSSQ